MNLDDVKRDSFVFYRSYFEAIDCLAPEEQLVLYRKICVYALDADRSKTGVKIVDGLFKLIAPLLDANTIKYLKGKKGGLAKKGKKKETIVKTQTIEVEDGTVILGDENE